MSEEYRFMRYYLPGSLFLVYLMILSIPNLAYETIMFLFRNAVGIFTGSFVASPIIGFLIYGFYNYLYEYWCARRTEARRALSYIESKNLTSFVQKKEFLDLIYHSSLKKEGKLEIAPQIVEALKNHLNAYSARVVCGFFVPIFSLIGFFLLQYGASDKFSWNRLDLFILSLSVIGVLSIVMLLDSERVLLETYQLEEYFVRAKEEEIQELVKKLFDSARATEEAAKTTESGR